MMNVARVRYAGNDEIWNSRILPRTISGVEASRAESASQPK